MSDCCNQKPEAKPESTSDEKLESKQVTGCCGPKMDDPSCHSKKQRPDYLLWISATIVLVCYVLYWLVDGHPDLPQWLVVMTSGVFELINRMWWGLLAAVIFVGLLERIPRDLVMSALGQGGTFKGIVRATFAGVLLDLCSHGILMVGTKLYERGASLGQLMAFLIASPWNSLSLTIILVALIGFGWTLAFVLLSMIVGVITGLIFDRLVSKGTLPANPNNGEITNGDSLGRQLGQLIKTMRITPTGILAVLKDGLKDSKMVFRWLFFGIVLATAIRAFVPLETYQTLFGPTVAGLLLTLLAATVIEVCSEGSTPIAADIVTRAAAPGNGFTFLMAGVATDYTEVMVIRDMTKSWKIALFLPLVSVPQILVIGWVLNQLG
ncbi:MAG: permease [Porticoccus sp.]